MKYLSHIVGLACFRIAQLLAPFDTGNLRYHAMFLVMRPNGFDIVYSDKFAHYIDFLEYGTMYSNQHVGFIENITFWAIVEYLEGLFNRTGRSKHAGKIGDVLTNVQSDYENTSNESRSLRLGESVRRYEVVG